MKILMMLLAMTTSAMAENVYSEQEALEERREYEGYARETMTPEEDDDFDYAIQQMLMMNKHLDYQYVDDCFTYSDMVCEFEEE